MKPSRRTQPYRRSAGRTKGPVLAAQKRGRPSYMANPQDVKRSLQKKKKRRVRRLARAVRRIY